MMHTYIIFGLIFKFLNQQLKSQSFLQQQQEGKEGTSLAVFENPMPNSFGRFAIDIV